MVTPAGSNVDATGYPGTWTEFLAWFPDEKAYAAHLEEAALTYRQTVRHDLRG